MQTDFDGKFELFDPVSVKSELTLNESIKEEVSLYPNPGSGNTIFVEFINFKPDNYLINVMDESGKLILNKEIIIEEGTNYLEIEILHGIILERGIHFVRVSSMEKVITSKYIVR